MNRAVAKKVIEMDAHRRERCLVKAHKAIESVPGVALGFGRNPRHEVAGDGRKRAVCDLYAVLDDGRILEVGGISTAPASLRRAIQSFQRRAAKKPRRARHVMKGRDPQQVAQEVLTRIDPSYRIARWLPVGTHRYARNGREYEVAYSYRDLVQVTHPLLGLSPLVEFRTLIRSTPPRDPFAELREIIASHALVHATYEGRVAACGYLSDKGRSVVQVTLPVPGKARPKAFRLMQSVRLNAVQAGRLGKKLPFLSAGKAGGFVVALLEAELPGVGPAVKIGKTSRTRAEIARCFEDRGYNFLVVRVLRYATFEDEAHARAFDAALLSATLEWKLDVRPEIEGHTEFRDFYKLTPLLEAFQRIEKTFVPPAETGASRKV